MAMKHWKENIVTLKHQFITIKQIVNTFLLFDFKRCKGYTISLDVQKKIVFREGKIQKEVNIVSGTV